MEPIPYVEFNCKNIFFDEFRGELVCADNGEVIEERIPVARFQSFFYRDSITTGIVKKHAEALSRAVELYKQGLAVREIMERTGIRSFSLLYATLKAMGLKRREGRPHKSWNSWNTREICKELESGASIYSIAKKLALNPSSVYYVRQRYCR
jgi:hypothetical protein